MPYAKTEAEWGTRAAAHLRALMKDAGVTYADLVKRLRKHGFKETEASLTMKFKRAAFSASFYLASLAALGRDGVKLEEL
ncbi:MAG: DUF6471 domain-containing protein [Rhizomicrobium sp.]